MITETKPNEPEQASCAPAAGSASVERRHPDCAAIGGPTASIQRGLIDDEMRMCIRCQHQCRWDLTEARFWGFQANCGERQAP